jgi:adenylosuccinate synthase
MNRGKLHFVVGGQYGSEGKGKIAGHLARKYNVDYSICSFSSQAGHTFYDNDGSKWMVQQVPMAVCNPNTKLLISQGAIIDLGILHREISQFGLSPDRLRIHPKAIVIQQRNKDYECEMLSGPKRIASTCKGNGAAMSDFVLRQDNVITMDMVEEFHDYLADTRAIINKSLDNGARCMAECAQGFSLDIYQGFYPYVTSRGCSVAAELARIGVAPQQVGNVYGVYRTFPIRVGNIEDDKGEQLGFSGNGFDDQTEVTWGDITKESKSDKPILERTTVTDRIRRVFTWSKKQFGLSVRVLGVTHLALTFVDYIDSNEYSKSGNFDEVGTSDAVRGWIRDNIYDVISGTSVYVEFLGTGPNDDMIITV